MIPLKQSLRSYVRRNVRNNSNDVCVNIKTNDASDHYHLKMWNGIVVDGFICLCLVVDISLNNLILKFNGQTNQAIYSGALFSIEEEKICRFLYDLIPVNCMRLRRMMYQLTSKSTIYEQLEWFSRANNKFASKIN